MNVNPASAEASGDQLTTKLSPLSVGATVARLTDLAASGGLKLFTVIDHSREARAAGLELRETKVVIFGSPEAGTPVMQAAPLAALDLPLKVLVWADGDQTKLTYTAPGALAARYELSDQLAGRLAGIDKLTDAVVAQSSEPGGSRPLAAFRRRRPYSGLNPRGGHFRRLAHLIIQ